jgi:hypothetical protein
MKTMITPGRLYFLMSAEFRKLRCADCANCALPLPRRLEGADATWTLEKWPRDCESCEREVLQLIRKYQACYDLLDPFSRPIPGRRKPPPGIQPFH